MQDSTGADVNFVSSVGDKVAPRRPDGFASKESPPGRYRSGPDQEENELCEVRERGGG